MAQGNILEAVLNQNIESKFKSIDDHLKSIEDSTRITTHTLIDFMANFKEFTNTLTGGVANSVSTLAKEMVRLNEAIGNMGNVSSSSASEAANDINRVSNMLNNLYKQRLQYENKVAGLETKKETYGILEKEIPDDLIKAIDGYQAKLDRVDKIIERISEKYPKLGQRRKEAWDTKQSEQNVLNEERYERAIERAIKAMQRLNAEKQKEAAQKIGLIGEQEPRTINEYIQAIKNLKREIGNMDVSDKDGIAKMRDRIEQYQKELDEAMPKQRQFANDAKHLGETLRSVASTFGLAFSADALIGYAKKIRDVTGEFELQHRAMQAIIGDMDKANRLWDKTIKLAVKSPYSVKELVTYTKQLAAYRIETEKLYDTTKMLADISAGLGVDMNRLILAYGQVKAANYLRGQELRQFSEAGVNILGELANYFSELKGEAISTGEVFEMVSKRMVKFEDVAEVLKRLTQEGGVFFNMQEIQAETLKGKYMNLQDSLDLMINKIGEYNKGVFVSFVDTAKYLADNWQTVGNTLKWVTGIVIGLRVAIKAGQIQLAATAAVTNGATIQTTLLTKILALFNKQVSEATGGTVMFGNALKGLGATGWAGGLLGGLMAVVGIVSAIVGHYRKLNEEQAKFERISNESAANMTKSVAQYRELASKIKDVNTSENERVELMAKMKRLYGDILPERLRNIEYITKEGNAYDEAITSIKAYYQALRQERIIDATVSEYEDKIQKRQEDTAKQIQKQIKKTYDLEVSITSINAAINQLRAEMDDGSVSAENFTERFQELLQIQTGAPIDFTAFNELIQGYGVVNTLVNPMESLVRMFQELTDKIAELTGRSQDFTKTMQDALNMDVFAKGLEKLNRQLDEDVANGLAGEGFENALKYRAEKAEELFKNQFEDFKKSDFYRSLNDAQKKAIQDQFEVQLKIKVYEQALKDSKVTIASKIDELINQFNLDNSQVGLIQKYLMGDTESNSEYYKRVKEDLETQLSNIKDIENGVYNGTEEEKERLLSMKPAFEMWLAFIEMLWGKTKSTHGGNKALELLNKQIDAIKNAAKQYDEYKKMYDDTEAFDKTKHEVEGLFKELNIGHILKNNGAFDENVIKDNLEVWLAKSIAAAGKGGQQVAEKYISGLQLAFEKENYSKTVIEPFKKAMEDAIDAISMGDELEKLGIGRDFGKIIFGIDTTTTKQMREQVEKWKQDLTASMKFGDEAEKEYQKMIEKIDDMEDKAQKERLKKYIGYMQQAMSERARIQVQGLAELAEIEKTFQVEIEKAYKAGDTARVQYLQEMQKAAIEGTRKATDEKLQKQTLEDFKGSDLYVEMFNNLETTSTRVIETIRQRIVELQGSLKDLNPSDLKAIVQEINKLDDELVKRNPFKGFIDAYKEVNALQKNGLTQDVLTERFVNLQNAINTSKEGVEALEVQLHNLENLDDTSIVEQFGTQEEWEKKLTNTREMIVLLKQTEATDTKSLSRVLQMIQAYENLGKAQKALSDYLQNLGGRVSSIFSSIMSNLEAFGGETTETSQAWGDLFSNIMNIIAVIPNYILLMKAAGVAANEALGVVGWIATAVQLLVTLIVGIAKIRDASITDTIDSYKDKVDALSDSYDRLEKAYDKAWDVQNLVSYRDQLQKNIDQQVKYYQAMIAAEQTRKDPDESQIREWKNAINDLFDEKDEKQKQFIEEMGGITDFKSAAQEFVDAWADAFSETGDGMEGLRDHFNEVLQNMVKKQAMQRVASHYLTGLFDMIDTAIGDNGMVTPQEMEALRAKFEEIAPQFNAALQAIFESLGIFGDQAEGELSGLQKGIQGVTEETAEILAAYLNSVRYYVIDSNTKLGQLQNILQDNTGMVNPMLAELRSIAQRADDIYNFLFQRRESGTDSMRVFVVNA